MNKIGNVDKYQKDIFAGGYRQNQIRQLHRNLFNGENVSKSASESK
jgi:hypothetical protein